MWTSEGAFVAVLVVTVVFVVMVAIVVTVAVVAIVVVVVVVVVAEVVIVVDATLWTSWRMLWLLVVNIRSITRYIHLIILVTDNISLGQLCKFLILHSL